MERELIERLMRGRKKSPTSMVGYAILSNGDKVPVSEVKESLGAFEGRVGSQKRSRKGRTYRAPNGSRRYVSNHGRPEVVAYLAKP